MKTITLTRPRLVQSQLNPARYTTGERCCAHFATQPTKTTTTASTEAGPLPASAACTEATSDNYRTAHCIAPRHRNQNRNDRRQICLTAIARCDMPSPDR
jgi:hypothetical protein